MRVLVRAGHRHPGSDGVWRMWEGGPWEDLASPPCSLGPFALPVLSHFPAEAGAAGSWGHLGVQGAPPRCTWGSRWVPCPHFHPRAASLGTAPGRGSCKDGSASPFTADPIRLQSEHSAFHLSFPT